MNRKPRIYYTETDKALMWNRWQKGEPLNEIARLFDRGHSSTQRILAVPGHWEGDPCSAATTARSQPW